MRPSLVVSLLLLSFLLHETKAIRLEKGFMKVGNQKIHEKEKSSLIEKSNGGFGDFVLCKEGHCTGMTSRKLSTVTTSTTTTSTTTSKNEENEGENKAKTSNIPMTKGKASNGEVGEEHEKFKINTSSSSPTSEQQKMNHDDHYVDIMDYSPAKKKPPIHN